MAILADKPQNSPRGSYFDTLSEKYPDLARASEVAPSGSSVLSKPTTEASSTAPSQAAAEQPTTQGSDTQALAKQGSAASNGPSFESPWLPVTLLVLLGLALLFPPALLWRPSWQPQETAAEPVDKTGVETLAPATEMSAQSVPAEPIPGWDGDSLRAAGPTGSPSDRAVLAPDKVAEATAGVVPRKFSAVQRTMETAAPPAAVPPTAAPPSAAPPTAIPPTAAAPPTALVTVANEQAVGQDSAIDRAVADDAEPASLELATAGPRIVPARRLWGETPPLTSPATAGQPARLRLRNHIDATGQVVGIDILQGASESVDRQLLEALWQWRYAPATVDGNPVASQQEVVFVLPLAGQPVQLAANEPIEPARRRVSPLPTYTEEAWVQGTQGDVELLASIDSRGKVTEVEVLRGLPHGLTQAAVHAVQGWKFEPARQSGQAVASTQRLLLRFAF